MHPSIFNDVLGPVMRGPSSSHSAAALRIGRLCRDLMNGDIKDVQIKYDVGGSLATTHKSQGSDMGLYGGFLGWGADDERLMGYEQAMGDAGINVELQLVDESGVEEGWTHPNTYHITLNNDHESHQVIALSLGGGMIEVIEIDRNKISIQGDYHELIITASNPTAIATYISDHLSVDHIEIGETFIEVKSHHAFSYNVLKDLEKLDGVKDVKYLAPVLPVLSRKDMTVPFTTAAEMQSYNKDKNLSLADLAVAYESARANMSKAEVRSQMTSIVATMRGAIDIGLSGTEYKDRILGCQSTTFKDRLADKKLVESGALNRIILYVTAMMEVKSSMGVIVAAPTAGSCGALPGALFGVADEINASEEAQVDAMLVAGLVGSFIAAGPGFAAEVGGCQAECGSGSGMAAAGIVTLMGGSFEQSLGAASMALQNSLGMICDPIGNRVEAPCLGRNTMAASNALSSANMALSDYAHLIPLDEVIEVMIEVGEHMHRNLRCTGLGGLAATKTARAIEENLGDGVVRTPFKSC
jgi:L-serine dehydratase